MSVQDLFNPNCNYNLYCASITSTANGGELTLPVMFSGPWASPQSGSVKFSKINGIVTVTVISLTSTASVAAEINATVAPAGYLSSSVASITQQITVEDNGVTKTGLLQYNNSGNMTISLNTANFAGAGTTGFYSFSFSYPLN
jgi:hypothetical protein